VDNKGKFVFLCISRPKIVNLVFPGHEFLRNVTPANNKERLYYQIEAAARKRFDVAFLSQRRRLSMPELATFCLRLRHDYNGRLRKIHY